VRAATLPAIGSPATDVTSPWAPPWRPARSPHLVAVLSFATFNLYAFYWLFATWRELKIERGDRSMRPGWHALSIVGPIHGIYQYYAHMRAIRDLARSAGAATSFDPMVCMLAWLTSSAIGLVSTVLSMQGVSSATWVSLAVLTFHGLLLAWAQSGLNVAWRALPGGARRYQLHPVTRVVLLVGLLLQVMSIAAHLV
jgi:hypothetical protein